MKKDVVTTQLYATGWIHEDYIELDYIFFSQEEEMEYINSRNISNNYLTWFNDMTITVSQVDWETAEVPECPNHIRHLDMGKSRDSIILI